MIFKSEKELGEYLKSLVEVKRVCIGANIVEVYEPNVKLIGFVYKFLELECVANKTICNNNLRYNATRNVVQFKKENLNPYTGCYNHRWVDVNFRDNVIFASTMQEGIDYAKVYAEEHVDLLIAGLKRDLERAKQEKRALEAKVDIANERVVMLNNALVKLMVKPIN